MGSEAKVSRGEVEVVVEAGCEGVVEVVVRLSLKVDSLGRGTGDLWSAGEAKLIQLDKLADIQVSFPVPTFVS